MASTLFDTLFPVISQSMAQAGPAALQGKLIGQQTAQELALKQLELQLMQQRFPMELQQIQADIGYKKALGTEAEARAGMYAGGLYPAGSIEEQKKRMVDLFGAQSTEGRAAMQFLNTIGMAKGGGPASREQLQPWLQPYIQSGGQIKPPGLDGSDPISRANQQTFSQMLREYGQPPLQTQMTVPGEFQGTTQTPAVPGTMPNLAQNRIDYAARKKAELSFMPGSTEGRSVRSFSTIIHHGNTLLKLVDALDSGDLRAVNRWSNLWSTETGGPAVTNFDAARKVFADEVSKAIIGGATALGDREANANSILALSSPAQLRGAIQTYMELASGQLDSYKHQYEATTGRKDFDRLLIPEARQKLQVQKPSALQQSPAYQQKQQNTQQATPDFRQSMLKYKALGKEQRAVLDEAYDGFLDGTKSADYFKTVAGIILGPNEGNTFSERMMQRKKAP